MMRPHRFPLTYDECRERFRWTVAGTEPPTAESLLDVTRAMIDEQGYQWVKSAVSAGQYTHPDGLYFGGDRTEESNRILAEVVAGRLAGAEEVLVLDLQTGHGAFGTHTLLSHVP